MPEWLTLGPTWVIKPQAHKDLFMPLSVKMKMCHAPCRL